MKGKNNASEFRRARLIELLNTYKVSGKAKSVAALAKQYDLDTSYISQLKTGRSHFGETAARNLEAKLQLPTRYFEPEVAEIELQAHEVGLERVQIETLVMNNDFFRQLKK